MNSARCSATNRHGLRCAKRVRAASATCRWHSHRERAFGAAFDAEVELHGPAMPSAPIVADWIVDATFRAMVGLEHAQYWILDTSAGGIWVAPANLAQRRRDRTLHRRRSHIDAVQSCEQGAAHASRSGCRRPSRRCLRMQLRVLVNTHAETIELPPEEAHLVDELTNDLRSHGAVAPDSLCVV